MSWSSNLLVIQNVWALKSLEDSKRLGIQIARGFKTPETRTACRRLRAGDTLKASKLRVCRSCAFFEVKRLRAIRLTFRTWLHLRRKDNL